MENEEQEKMNKLFKDFNETIEHFMSRHELKSFEMIEALFYGMKSNAKYNLALYQQNLIKTREKESTQDMQE